VHLGRRCDTIEEFNVDSKAECKSIAYETETKTRRAHLVQYMFKIMKAVRKSKQCDKKASKHTLVTQR